MAYYKSGVMDKHSILGFSWSQVFLFVVFFTFFSKLRDGVMGLVGWNPFNSKVPDKKPGAVMPPEEKAKVDTTKLKVSNTVYKAKADQLYDAMNGMDTDAGAVLDVLSGLNKEEIKQVYNAFGVRDNHQFGLVCMTGNLVEWIIYEMDGTYEKNFVLPDIQKLFAGTGLW